MRLHPWFLLAFAFLWVPSAEAVTPHLVKDIDTIPDTADSSPYEFVAAAGVAFFTASDGETGTELWRSDGTLAGTFRITDACPGECSSRIRTLAATDRSYFFLATFLLPSGESGEDLWVTNGTPAGTFRLSSSLRFPAPETLIWFVWSASQRVLYFAADDGAHGLELWRTDGTPVGTTLVADIWPGPEGSDPRLLVDFNGRLVFRANDGRLGPSLWKSDGTAQGTQLVRDLIPGSSTHEGPGYARVAGKVFYFRGPSSVPGTQLWRSDGTPQGTYPLTRLVPRPGSSETLLSVSVLGNRLFFVADTKALGQEVWVTDGTVKGTRALTSFPKAEAFASADFSFFLALPEQHLGNRMVFAVDDGEHGVELWTTDGTGAGTRLLRDICSGACSGTGSVLVLNGNRLYFAAFDEVSGSEPWVTDGTTAGTRMVRDLCAGRCSSAPFVFLPAGRWVYFRAVGATDQLWRTNGTAQGTVLLTPIEVPPFTSRYRGFQRVALGRNLLFASSYDGSAGLELWRSDGTPQGTGLLADLNITDLGGSYPTNLAAVGNQAYFFADDGAEDGVWRSDGTEAGTARVLEFSALEGGLGFEGQLLGLGGTPLGFIRFGAGGTPLWRLDGSVPVRLTPEGIFSDLRAGWGILGNTLFFVAGDEDHGAELWRTDGTEAGTRLAVDLVPGFSGSRPEKLTVFKGRLYFTADVDDTRRELWNTDGTEAGTVLVKDIQPDFSSDPDLLTEHGGRLWFFATDDEHGRELWSTDGTPAGVRLHELAAGPEGFQASRILWEGDRLFLFGNGLWVSDTTAAGTHRISATRIANPVFYPSPPVESAGTVYFSGQTPEGFTETLWKSDGTAVGTAEVLDRGGLPVYQPDSFQAFAGRVYFTSKFGGELFQTDGTSAGTFPLLDLRSPQGYGSLDLVRVGSRLFFSKWDRATGTELWALEEN